MFSTRLLLRKVTPAWSRRIEHGARRARYLARVQDRCSIVSTRSARSPCQGDSCCRRGKYLIWIRCRGKFVGVGSTEGRKRRVEPSWVLSRNTVGSTGRFGKNVNRQVPQNEKRHHRPLRQECQVPTPIKETAGFKLQQKEREDGGEFSSVVGRMNAETKDKKSIEEEAAECQKYC